MERAERQTREKYTETRSKLAEYEGDIQNLHATIKQLEIQLNHSQKVFFLLFLIIRKSMCYAKGMHGIIN